MPNEKIAKLISNGLRDGLMTPSRADRPPEPIMLPLFRTAGMPPEMADLMNTTADLLGEAIVALIENEGGSVLVDKDRVAAIEAIEAIEADAPRRQVTVHCNCDYDHTDPLAILTVTNGPYVVINGKQLLTGLAGRTVECPHRRSP